MLGPDLSLGLGSGPLCSDRHQTLYRLFTGHSYVVCKQEFTFSGEVFIWALFGPDVSLGLGSGPLYVGSPRKLTPLLGDIFMVVSGHGFTFQVNVLNGPWVGPVMLGSTPNFVKLFTGHSYVVCDHDFTFSGLFFYWALFGPDVSLGLGSSQLYSFRHQT